METRIKILESVANAAKSVLANHINTDGWIALSLAIQELNAFDKKIEVEE